MLLVRLNYKLSFFNKFNENIWIKSYCLVTVWEQPMKIIQSNKMWTENIVVKNLNFLYSILLVKLPTSNFLNSIKYILYLYYWQYMLILWCSWFNIVWKRFDIRFVNIKIQFMYTSESLYYYLNGGLDK